MVCTPTHCRRCGHALQGSDPQPHRHQVVELPPPIPHVTEYQQQRLVCDHCGITTRGELPQGVPTTGYGPRFTSIVALCSGAYRMSKRMISHFSREVWGIPLSLGEVCALEQVVRRAVQEPVDDVRDSVQWSDTNVDETRWREQNRRVQLWTVVTPQASVYAIRRSRGAKVLHELLGKDYAGTIGSDRAKAYDCYPLRQRQLCWSHLRRDAQAMIDRGGPGRKVGEQLLEHANVLFAWRRWLREGKWSRSTWQHQMRGLRRSFRQELQWGTRVRCKKTAATCRELLSQRAGLWTFVQIPEIPETNNVAERRFAIPSNGVRPAMARRVSAVVALWRAFSPSRDVSATPAKCLCLSHRVLSRLFPDCGSPRVDSPAGLTSTAPAVRPRERTLSLNTYFI